MKKQVLITDSRVVNQVIEIKLTTNDLNPRKDINNADSYACSLHLKTGSGLLQYSKRSRNLVNKAVGSDLVNIRLGKIDKRKVPRNGNVAIKSGLLKATGVLNKPVPKIKTVVFKVPVNVTQIHPDIKFVTPMCRGSKSSLQNNANQIDRFRVDVPVNSSRQVNKTVEIPLKGFNLTPGANMNDMTHYNCVLYLKKSSSGQLLSYSLSSRDEATKAAVQPTNVTIGEISRKLMDSAGNIKIRTGMLKAKGAL